MQITEYIRGYAAERSGTIQRDTKKWVERLMFTHKGHLNPTRGIHP